MTLKNYTSSEHKNRYLIEPFVHTLYEMLKTFDDGHTSLQLQETEVVDIVNNVKNAFHLAHDEKPIHAGFLHHTTINQFVYPLQLMLDDHFIEYNEMMVSFDFETEHSKVHCNMDQLKRYLQLSIRDSSSKTSLTYFMNVTHSRAVKECASPLSLMSILSNEHNRKKIDECSSVPWTAEWIHSRRGAIELKKYDL